MRPHHRRHPQLKKFLTGFNAKNLVPHRGARRAGAARRRARAARGAETGNLGSIGRSDVLTSAAALRIARVAMSRHPVRHTHNISHTESKYKQYIWPIGNTSKETQAQWPKRMLCVGHPIFSRRSALAWFASTCTLTLPHPALFSIWNVQSDFHTGKYATKKEAEAAFESTIRFGLQISDLKDFISPDWVEEEDEGGEEEGEEEDEEVEEEEEDVEEEEEEEEEEEDEEEEEEDEEEEEEDGEAQRQQEHQQFQERLQRMLSAQRMSGKIATETYRAVYKATVGCERG